MPSNADLIKNRTQMSNSEGLRTNPSWPGLSDDHILCVSFHIGLFHAPLVDPIQIIKSAKADQGLLFVGLTFQCVSIFYNNAICETDEHIPGLSRLQI